MSSSTLESVAASLRTYFAKPDYFRVGNALVRILLIDRDLCLHPWPPPSPPISDDAAAAQGPPATALPEDSSNVPALRVIPV